MIARVVVIAIGGVCGHVDDYAAHVGSRRRPVELETGRISYSALCAPSGVFDILQWLRSRARRAEGFTLKCGWRASQLREPVRAGGKGTGHGLVVACLPRSQLESPASLGGIGNSHH